ncbi:MAG: right-handed parallel beta-helix repeat-containing protein [Ferruginibacter sp.]
MFITGVISILKILEFVGANSEGISLSITTGVTIEDCFIHYSGTNGVRARASVSPTVLNCTLWDNFNSAASFDDSGNSNAVIKGNKIARTGAIPGMGNDLVGINLTGSGHLVEANTIDSTGFNPIYFAYGSNITIKNNVINTYCYVKSDGGGIYTWNNTSNPTNYTNRKIIGNIILNGVGAPEGTAGSTPDVDGIYMDDNTGNVDILDNTVSNVAGAGMYIHNNYNMNVQRNTLYANHREQMNFTHNLAYINGALSPYTTPLRNITVKNNVLFSKYSDQTVFTAYSIRNDLDSTGTTDSNYYARPIDDTWTIDATRNVSGTYVSGDYTLSTWKTTFKKDAASKKAPLSIPQYTISGFATANLYTNGQYTSNISGTSIYSSNGNHTLSWDNTGKISGGALKLSFPTINSTTYTSLYASVGSISSTKTYVLRFTTVGTTDSGSARIYLRKTGSPYSALSASIIKTFGTAKTDHEIMFAAPTTEAAASILIEFKQNSGTLYLDNVEFYEANIAMTNIDDNVKFVYNATAAPVTVPLAYKYLSVDSIEYNGSITLQPYTSKVLLKKGALSGTLPVKLVNFGAANVNDKIKVEWKTTAEVKSSHYIVQRSSNGKDFENAGSINSKNNVEGQSVYNFTDATPFKGTSYYRLAMVDKDGMTEYSNVVPVSVKSRNGLQVDNIVLSAASATLKMTLTSDKKQPVNVAVIDASGRALLTTQVLTQQGSARIEKNIPAISTGVYYVKVFTEEDSYTKTLLSSK